MINKNGLLFILCLVVIGCSENRTQESDASLKPNIVLFFVDDLGWQDTSVPFFEDSTLFNKRYHTPNIERLAEQGMLFTEAYSASPVCTPSRSSILTGQNPGRSDITNWTLRNDIAEQETSARSYPLRSPDGWKVEGVQPDSSLLPMLLKNHGYRTIHAGKAHFGAIGTDGANPKNLGFDVNIAGHAAGAPGSYLPGDKYGNERPDTPWGVPGLERYYDSNTFLSEALTIEANKAIDQAIAEDKPFFINMAHYAVHAPIMADRRYFDDYLEQGVDSTESKYASLIEGIDSSLGKIWQNLEEEGVAENSIILFMSDNGGLSAHSRGETPMGTGANTHNKPLRSGKGSAYEGGIRVPMIVAWAKHSDGQSVQTRFPIKADSRNDTPVISEDFYPSILELAGIEFEDAADSMDGESFVVKLKDSIAPETQRMLFWHYPHKWGPEGPGYDPFTAVRNGKWKLIYFYNGQIWELYNLEEDIGESNNVFNQNPEVAQRLSKGMVRWMEKVGAQRPVSRRTGEPVPIPSLKE